MRSSARDDDVLVRPAAHRGDASKVTVASRYASSGVRPSRRATMYGAYQSDHWCFGAVASNCGGCHQPYRVSK